jgi:type IV secretion system protein TrbG
MTKAIDSEFFGPPSMARSTLEGGKGGCLERSATLWPRGFEAPRGLDRGGPLCRAFALLMLSACQPYAMPLSLRHPGLIAGGMIIAAMFALGLVVLNAVDRCNRRMGAIIVIVAAFLPFMLEGCAMQEPMPALPPPVIAQAPKHKPRHIITPAEILAAQPPEIQQVIAKHGQGRPWPTIRHGATVLYPYNPDSSPNVDAAPLRTTDIQLHAGETVTDVALGDAQRWMANAASAGDPHNATPHIVVKPEIAGIDTNLTVYTTARIYHLNLYARGRAMQEVEFYFPDEVQQQMAEAEQAVKQPAADDDNVADAAQSALPEVEPSKLNYSYKIDGAHNLAFTPVRVFDDGTRVYLQMPARMQTASAPALMLDGNAGPQMVNYRSVPLADGGSYFVVDRLFDKAELMSGVGGDSEHVSVTYSGAAR